MYQNKVIEFTAYQPKSSDFDYSAYNRRAQARFRSSQIRKNLLTTVDLIVTALIGIGFAGCFILVCSWL